MRTLSSDCGVHAASTADGQHCDWGAPSVCATLSSVASHRPSKLGFLRPNDCIHLQHIFVVFHIEKLHRVSIGPALNWAQPVTRSLTHCSTCMAQRSHTRLRLVAPRFPRVIRMYPRLELHSTFLACVRLRARSPHGCVQNFVHDRSTCARSSWIRCCKPRTSLASQMCF